VVKRIVDDHATFGTRIEVSSPEGRGAVFSLHLKKPDPPG
jgi:hypothetical protein